MNTDKPYVTHLNYEFLDSPKTEFANVLTSPEFFQNGSIFVIELDDKSYVKDYCVNDVCNSFLEYNSFLNGILAQKHTLKIENFEYYNDTIYRFCHTLYDIWHKPVNCHAYFGFEGRGSFEMHTDPCNVVIVVTEGTKTVVAGDTTFVLKAGDSLYIPPNCPHKAHNDTDCLSLSFGSFDFDNTVKGFLNTL